MDGLRHVPDLGEVIWHPLYNRGVVIRHGDRDGHPVEADDAEAVVVLIEWDEGGYSSMLIDDLEPRRPI